MAAGRFCSGLVWAMAIVGIALKFALPRVKTGLSVGIQHSMGWLSLAAMPLIWQRVGPAAVLLVFAGGVCYTVGTVIFAIKRPRLFPNVFSYHELFHVLVVAGSTLHFLAVLWYVMPYGRGPTLGVRAQARRNQDSSFASASSSSMMVGTRPLRFSWPSSVTRMSSSIRTPIPRNCLRDRMPQLLGLFLHLVQFLASRRTLHEGSLEPLIEVILNRGTSISSR